MSRLFFSMLAVVPLWACELKDPCEDAGQYETALALGVGERSFDILMDGDALDAEQGGQGSSHVWIAAEMSGLYTGRKFGGSAEHQPPEFVVTLTNDVGDELGYGATNTSVPDGDASLAELTGLRLFLEFAGYGAPTGPEDRSLGILTLEARDSCGTELRDERLVSL